MGETDQDLTIFLGEAEEHLAAFNDVLVSVPSGGEPRPSHINTMFRATHTLKGLAGMLEFQTLNRLSHGLEDLLGAVRLGQVPWSDRLQEILLHGADYLERIIRGIGRGEGDEIDLGDFLDRVLKAATEGEADQAELDVDLPADLLASLTEYEEARLRHAVREENRLYGIVFRLALARFSEEGNELAESLESSGEIITKLPAKGESKPGELNFLYLYASKEPKVETMVRSVLDKRLISIETIRAAWKETQAAAGKEAPAKAAGATAASAQGETATFKAEPASSPRGSASASVRINLELLDELTTRVGGLLAEKALLDGIAATLYQVIGDEPPYPELLGTIKEIEKRLAELQRRLMMVRLVPIGQIFGRLRRVVQSYSRKSGKQIDLVLEGGETRLDKVIIEKLADPLIHIIRNAIDHGIEEAETRREIGKGEKGSVILSASPRGGQILISVKDDGGGIDWDRVKEKAVEKGLVSSEGEPTQQELQAVLFQPGFSTSDKVTEISGRGVGMDVVHKNLMEVNAFVDIRSVRHEGTRMTVTVPITLAIFRSLIVASRGRRFALPLASVIETLRLRVDEVHSIEGRSVMRHRNQEIVIRDLGLLLGLSEQDADSRKNLYFVIVGSVERRIAIQVDRILGEREIVTKPLGKFLAGVPGISGGALVGERQLALVLDVGRLVSGGTV